MILRKDPARQFRKSSFAQSGEDLIIEYLFKWMGIEEPSYLDIGAHHPYLLSNTYLFYEHGSQGVCVEPDPVLFEEIARKRTRDLCLNVGVGKKKGSDTLYVMSERTLNTFSKQEAEMYQKHYPGTTIQEEREVQLLPINDIIGKYFKPHPNLLSIDIEGLDYIILQTINFSRYRPEIICIETAVYTGKESLSKNFDLINFMNRHKYFLYADTFTNSIFVCEQAWEAHRMPVIENTLR